MTPEEYESEIQRANGLARAALIIACIAIALAILGIFMPLQL